MLPLVAFIEQIRSIYVDEPKEVILQRSLSNTKMYREPDEYPRVTCPTNAEAAKRCKEAVVPMFVATVILPFAIVTETID